MTLRRRLALTVALTAVPLVLGVWWVRRRVEIERLEDSMRELAVAHMEAVGRMRCEADPERWVFDTLTRPEERPGPPGEGPPGPRPPRGPGGRGFGPGGGGRGPGGPPPPPRRDGPPDEGPFGPPPPRPPDGEEDAGPPGEPPPPASRPPPGPRSGSPAGRATLMWAYRADLTSANPHAPTIPPEVAEAILGGAAEAGAPWAEGPHRGRQLAVRMAWTEGPCAVVLVQRPFDDPPLGSDPFVLGSLVVALGLLLAMLAAAGPMVRRIRRLTQEVQRAAASHYAEGVSVSGSDEISRLAGAFDAAGREVREHVERLERRDRTLRDFVANTTHDVMIPLTVLQGHLDRIGRRAEAGEPPEGATVHDARAEAHYLGCLLQNLGAAAKLEAGDVHLQLAPVDLGALVERVVARHRPVAEGRGVEIAFAVPPETVSVPGDVTLLEQAVSNVVHNAVRHGRDGGHVAVVLETPRAQAGRFELRVVDDGPGVPAEELPRLRERRFRGGAARSRAPDGAGLGLAIAHDVAERHGFALDIAPSDAGGLEVVLRGRLVQPTR